MTSLSLLADRTVNSFVYLDLWNFPICFSDMSLCNPHTSFDLVREPYTKISQEGLIDLYMYHLLCCLECLNEYYLFIIRNQQTALIMEKKEDADKMADTHSVEVTDSHTCVDGGDLETDQLKTDGKPMTAERYNLLKEEMKKDPKWKIIIDGIKSLQERNLRQVEDPSSCLKITRLRNFSPQQLVPYLATSPTAKKYMRACEYCINGFAILNQYGKRTVDNDDDCDVLETAFANYSLAHMLENVFMIIFPPPQYIMDLLSNYIILRPNDVLAQHLRVALIFHHFSASDIVSKYDELKEKIVEAELLAEKIRHLPESNYERMVLIDTYYILGSLYSITVQHERALDSFQKSYRLDPLNHSSLYGVACHQLESGNPDEAIELFGKYLDIAPRCDCKYANCLYQLGKCYLTYYKNIKEALKYYELGLKNEKEDRLSCDGSVDLPAKEGLKVLQHTYKTFQN